MKAAEFVAAVGSIPVPRHSQNLYGVDSAESLARRANLCRYLDLMHHRAPRFLLVGEAPGYRGAVGTGVPFTSPRLLFGAQVLGHGFERVPRANPNQAEASATIVWQTIAAVRETPLLWNIVPFHPHQPGALASNRSPTAAEIALGQPFVAQLLALMPVQTVVAVGQRAAHGLAALGVDHTAIRHPSHGGKRAFVSGWRQLIEEQENCQ
jgi:uracil-DNA glycosylase